LYPATTDVLAVQVRSTLCCGGAVPVPETDSTVGEVVALLTNVIAPDALPELCGVNVTVKDAFCPALMVTGNEIPLRTNSALLELPELTVTLPPLAESVPELLWLCPTTTLPRFIDVGETLSWLGVNPLPESGIERFGLGASEMIEMLPLLFPFFVGANETLKVAL